MKTIFDVFQVSGPPMLRAGADLWVDLVPEEIILDPVAPARLGPNITLSCKVGGIGDYFIWGVARLGKADQSQLLSGREMELPTRASGLTKVSRV